MQTGIWPKVGSGWTSNHTLSYFTFKGPVYLQIILWHPIPGPMAKTSSGSKDRELSSPLHPKALPLFHLLGHAGPHSPYMQIWISPSILRKWFIQQERKGVGNFWKFSTTCEVKGALVSSREPSLIYYYYLFIIIPREPWALEPVVRNLFYGFLTKYGCWPNGQTQIGHLLFIRPKSRWSELFSKNKIKSSNIYWAAALCQTLNWITHDLCPQGTRKLAGESEMRTTNSHLWA